MMLVTVFNAPLLWCNIAIGLSGTIYTALGGLRGVVWTDCMQFIIILVAPTALFAKIMVDSLSANSTVQPLSDMDAGMYIGDFRFDLTSDENVWSCIVGASTLAMYRLCLDQMVVQRIMSSPSVKKAKRTVISGAFLLLLPYASCTLLGISITIWYRGCDPVLSGAIKRVDQARTLIKLKQEVTKTIATDPETPEFDQHLLHLWDARQQLTRRWERQKLNRKLRLRIAEVTAQAEEYAT
ncbi:sodium/iodide cotransporter-like [Dermacentor silvarum]|uniref:sodium/iodide cotransporter-like n=1 Tax=Dermacentor silvarum TaxID=543639 RepID=UPI002101B7AF|nr:sodium/iodide cotransporter-like [Dermacentor silvarum]